MQRQRIVLVAGVSSLNHAALKARMRYFMRGEQQIPRHTCTQNGMPPYNENIDCLYLMCTCGKRKMKVRVQASSYRSSTYLNNLYFVRKVLLSQTIFYAGLYLLG